MAKYKRLTKREFDRIKELLKVGVAKNVITAMTDRSYPLIKHVESRESFEEFVADRKPNNKRPTQAERPRGDYPLIVDRLDSIVSDIDKIKKRLLIK